MLQRKNSGKGKGESMNNGSMEKAWYQFGGVWPKRTAFHGVSKKDERILLCVSSGSNVGGEQGDIIAGGSSFNSNYYCEIFNKQQFEAFGEAIKKEYLPEVGEECEAYEYSTKKNRKSVYIGEDPRSKDSSWKAFSTITTGIPFFSDRYKFRPIKTEREKFIDQAIDDYLVQVGSDAVNREWYGRIFGAMYDARYRKND